MPIRGGGVHVASVRDPTRSHHWNVPFGTFSSDHIYFIMLFTWGNSIDHGAMYSQPDTHMYAVIFMVPCTISVSITTNQ